MITYMLHASLSFPYFFSKFVLKCQIFNTHRCPALDQGHPITPSYMYWGNGDPVPWRRCGSSSMINPVLTITWTNNMCVATGKRQFLWVAFFSLTMVFTNKRYTNLPLGPRKVQVGSRKMNDNCAVTPVTFSNDIWFLLKHVWPFYL